MLRTITVEWGDYKAVVQEQTGLQYMTETVSFLHILSVIRNEKITSWNDAGEVSLVEDTFLLMVTRTKEVVGFAWCTPDSSNKDIKAAFKGIESLPGGFVRKWHTALNDLQEPPAGDPELGPANGLAKEQKKIQE